MRLNLIGWSMFWVLLFGLASPSIFAQTTLSKGPRKIVKSLEGVISARQAVLRAKPSRKAQVVARLKKGNRIRVVSHTRNWFRVRLKLAGGGLMDAWIEKKVVKLFPPKDRVRKRVPSASRRRASRIQVPSAIIEPKTPQLQPHQTIQREISPTSGFRAFASPIFDIHQFGAQQYRFGGSYDFPLSKMISLGIPASYSTGDGFNSIQGGLDMWIHMIKWKNIHMFSRTGLYFERFSGKNRSFIAGTADFALGFRYITTDSLSLGLEPISVEVMPIASKGIPLNVRGQILLDVRYGW